MSDKPLILVSNDDGIDAPGLHHLVESLRPLAKCLVVAPRRNRSAIGHAISIHEPVRIEKTYREHGSVQFVAVHGTPADAVKFALKSYCPTPPLLTVSGINPGPNIGLNVLYSGTVGAALESAAQGISALAVSVDNAISPFWETAMAMIGRIAPVAIEMEIRRQTAADETPPFCLNINVPDRSPDDVRGIRLTRQGKSGFDEFFHLHPDDPEDHYRLSGEMQYRDSHIGYDATALREGFVSVTPLGTDLTDHRLLAGMSDTPPPGWSAEPLS